MENCIITGIGCFAGPEKLSRILLRMLKTYSLGGLDGFEWSHNSDCEDIEGSKLIKSLIAGNADSRESSVPGTLERFENKKITGFFLTLKDQRLKLSIFARKGKNQQERYSAILEGFTRMRQNRMN